MLSFIEDANLRLKHLRNYSIIDYGPSFNDKNMWHSQYLKSVTFSALKTSSYGLEKQGTHHLMESGIRNEIELNTSIGLRD